MKMAEPLDAYGRAGKTAIDARAASAVGKAFAELFVEVGARAAIGDLYRQAASAAAPGLGWGAFGLGCDVSDATSVEATYQKTAELLGGWLDILGKNSAYRSETRAMLFLASDASSCITGDHLTVDDGYHVS
jgi:3-oxoacyl-[acyl-carrier protein] reductase